jgi:hypothetical protein
MKDKELSRPFILRCTGVNYENYFAQVDIVSWMLAYAQHVKGTEKTPEKVVVEMAQALNSLRGDPHIKDVNDASDG